jgi:hypothetical protein
MTVGELVELLDAFDDDVEVIVDAGGGVYDKVTVSGDGGVCTILAE